MNDSLFDLETLSLITSMITTYCGLFYIGDIPSTWDNVDSSIVSTYLDLNDSSKEFFFSVIIISNAIFFVYWLYKMLTEFKGAILNNCPRTYFFLFACMNKEKFEVDKYKRQVID